MKVYINGLELEGVSKFKIDKDRKSNRSKLFITVCDEDFMLFLDQLSLKFEGEDAKVILGDTLKNLSQEEEKVCKECQKLRVIVS